jgi:hypothetical protein
MKSTDLRYLIIIGLLMAHLFAKKSTPKRVPVSGKKQGRWANKAGGPTRQVGQQGRWTTWQVGQQGRWTTWQVGHQGRWVNKAGGPTRQVGQQGRQVYLTTNHVLKLLTLARRKKNLRLLPKAIFYSCVTFLLTSCE